MWEGNSLIVFYLSRPFKGTIFCFCLKEVIVLSWLAYQGRKVIDKNKNEKHRWHYRLLRRYISNEIDRTAARRSYSKMFLDTGANNQKNKSTSSLGCSAANDVENQVKRDHSRISSTSRFRRISPAFSSCSAPSSLDTFTLSFLAKTNETHRQNVLT